ncbi:exopolysaccharide biosynthesis polyprenyl glycosylphosphotransferase [Sporomusaceae bacterium BoRhaA]|uniref:sugar transferase n=1 Tax=Pelorhabdus rhamnosifermentans TaxID=2772457 RepID=UPI001C05F338|nr:sugar transferase [Pelorhabdus rhamnosifermentans]MBU2699037.1 exopolysaccharide biosynthesis polyprenyl glycosylphosphotransferase [Pelorhabdus rhamnosifermentans]
MRKRFPMLRKLALLMGDMSLLFIATYLAIFVVSYFGRQQLILTSYLNMSPIMVIAAGILFNVNGLFSLSRKKYSEVLLSLVVSIFNLFIIMMAASFFLREFDYSRSVLVITAFFEFTFLAAWKYLFWRVDKSSMQPNNVLVVGSQSKSFRIVARLTAQPHLNYHVRYVCTDYKEDSWKKAAIEIDLVILCSDIGLEEKAAIVHFCHVHGKQVFIVPDFYDLFCSGSELDKIDDIPVFRAQYLKPTLEQRSLKRILDLVVAGTTMLFLWPLFLIIAIAVKLDSQGPIFYSQVRTGRDEREFSVLKFRSMRQDAEQLTGPVLAAENDPRITSIGRFLRATRMDELPQLLNVLSGDMSIVGPRPERPVFVEQFKQEIPEYLYRHNVKPGITGMAQVYGKYNTTPNNKLIYDLMYIQKCNVLTDLVIMLQTVRVLVTKSSTEGIGVQQNKQNLSSYEINEIG